MSQRICPECESPRDEKDFAWTFDRYGIAYKKVCVSGGCVTKVQDRISQWVFHPDDAGESLEPD